VDLYALPPVAALLDGAHRLLMAFAGLLEPVIGVSSAAAAIILVTLLVRIALVPVGISQAKAERTRARLAPRLAELRRRHGTDPERLQRETMALYTSEGASPFAGCLPMLVQAPVVGVIYALFILPTVAGHPNVLLEQQLGGVPLGTSLAGSIVAGALTPTSAAVFAVVIGSVGEITRRVFRPNLTGPLHAVPGSALPNAIIAERLLGVLQFITAVIAVFVPLAAALYLLVTVAWTLGQRMVLRRVFPAPAG
jgi:YidC/Oxa1 family membrane protein insertase